MAMQLTRFTQRTTVDDSSWEPDRVTLQVRFCEGGSAYQESEIVAAILQKELAGIVEF